MKIVSILTLALAGVSAFAAEAADTRCYELRVYFAAPGKLDALNARFRDHSCALLEKHGFTNIGYWTPVDNPDSKLIYIIASPSRAAHDKAWEAFKADPEWIKARDASEVDGKLVTKVDSYYLTATDFSPEIQPVKADAERSFELRTYTPAKDKLEALLARFRDHTVKLFEKHGMANVGYWTSEAKDQQPAQLIYILAHKSPEAGKASFDAFRADPAWQEAKKASEVNGSLTEKVESVYMTPTDYSPLK